MANDGSVVIGIDGDSSGFKKELSGIGGVAKSALSGMGNIAKTAMVGVGTAIGAVTTAVGAIGTASAKVGMDFESSMSQVAATMGMTTEQLAAGSTEFDLLKQAAKDAGASTAFSATEAAEALNYLALAGYDAETAADALPAVLNLAAAGGLDLAYASDLATDAMSALGIEASKENLTKFGDQMARTASKANTSVGQLGEAILTVGGTAKSLAGGTTELNAALGVLANRGIKGSEGGTALRNVILSLSAPTDKAAGAMEALGLEGATTLCTAAATFGLIAGSLMGGPLGRRLILKHDLLKTAIPVDDGPLVEDEQKHHRSVRGYAPAAYQIAIAMGVGTIVSWALTTVTTMNFPVYIGAMIIAAIMRNFSEFTGKFEVPMGEINDIGGICLSLFLGIAMITLKLWQLAALAIPLIVLLVVQAVLMFLFAYFVVFNVMGRNYDAAVLAAGSCGFGMGATPNAMANMQALTDRFVPSVKAYILVPIVGSMFADFINSLTSTFFINML